MKWLKRSWYLFKIDIFWNTITLLKWKHGCSANKCVLCSGSRASSGWKTCGLRERGLRQGVGCQSKVSNIMWQPIRGKQPSVTANQRLATFCDSQSEVSNLLWQPIRGEKPSVKANQRWETFCESQSEVSNLLWQPIEGEQPSVTANRRWATFCDSWSEVSNPLWQLIEGKQPSVTADQRGATFCDSQSEVSNLLWQPIRGEQPSVTANQRWATFCNSQSEVSTCIWSLLWFYLNSCSRLFSSPKHKVLMVSYCGQWLSVVRCRASCVVRQHLMFTI